METNRSEGCPAWRLTAKILGWLWVAIGVIWTTLIFHYNRSITLGDAFTFVFVMATAALWLYGLVKNKILVMMISLVFSGIQNAFCLLMVIIFAIAIFRAALVKADDRSQVFARNPAWSLVGLGIEAVLIVINFSLAFICLVKIKNDIKQSTNREVCSRRQKIERKSFLNFCIRK